jgi:hypothetical protein
MILSESGQRPAGAVPTRAAEKLMSLFVIRTHRARLGANGSGGRAG